MQLSTFVASVLAVTASAAPTYPTITVTDAGSAIDALGSLSGYFNLVADKVKAVKSYGTAPVCDLSQAKMPLDGQLPSPAKGLKLVHVAIGRGTQNYTCDTSKPSSAPVATGAVATLFNGSCVAAMYPDLIERIPGMAVHFPLSDANKLGPASLAESGHHYFTADGTPFFDLRTPNQDIGEAPCAKNSSAPAPSLSAKGQLGENAVPWLRLTTIEGATHKMKEVYRTTTAGGSAPATCQGMDAEFEVQYATLYWFWAGDIEEDDA
ncbi:malate dehydrogenase [Fusarium fujikuroi]|nr:malate dehydrogenase [Fusarium fujikuroi]SCO11876.1 related to malate dehydrogenase [Fusarium fujikuroi]